MHLRPIRNWVTIEVKLSDTTTKSGIIFSSEKKPTEVGTIVDVSSEIINPQVAIGDTIMFSKYLPLEISTGDYKVSVIEYSDIYGVLED